MVSAPPHPPPNGNRREAEGEQREFEDERLTDGWSSFFFSVYRPDLGVSRRSNPGSRPTLGPARGQLRGPGTSIQG